MCSIGSEQREKKRVHINVSGEKEGKTHTNINTTPRESAIERE
jgi:hypothetical protein